MPRVFRQIDSTDAELDTALTRGRQKMKRDGPRAVHYDAASDRIEITMNDLATVSIVRKAIPGLEHATPKQLSGVRLTPLRTSITFDRLDADYSVNGLVRKMLGLNAQQRAAGGVSSPAKRSASIVNGRRGGRPRKKTAAQ